MEEQITKTLRRVKTWKKEETATIVPFSGIQILDFEFKLPEKRIRHDYIEGFVPSNNNRGTTFEDTVENRIKRLVPLRDDEDEDEDEDEPSVEQSVKSQLEDITEYTISSKDALKPFLNQWVPVPVLRIRKGLERTGDESFDQGPTTWARMRIVNLDQDGKDLGISFRVQLAIDTSLCEQNMTEVYLAPEFEDSKTSREFRLVTEPSLMSWFLKRPALDEHGNPTDIDCQKWVSNWLEDLMFNFFNQKVGRRPLNRRTEGADLENWSRYLSCLRVVDKLVNVPKLRLANTVSENKREEFVHVDLVLDVGNSRTCGIMVEQFPDNTTVDFSQVYELAIRDLSSPEYYYKGLFESRVEFADVTFGNYQCAKDSGRDNSFLWPSMVRTGPEAIRLTENEEGTETLSGISSPKRYLWDGKATTQTWRFHNHNDPNSLPIVAEAMMDFLNDAGDHLEQIKEEVKQKLRLADVDSPHPTDQTNFSRSSMYCFMLTEIISHALVQINDPADRSTRKQADLPRRLRNIVLTIPTATPVQEQAIIRSRANSALKLCWDIMEMSGQVQKGLTPPVVKVEWDEASCTQMVYLFNEITQRFNGYIDNYLKIAGTPRVLQEGQSEIDSIRIATIDIGGGTTDLMITTYTCEDNSLIRPKQNFREGFRIAGDDILKEIISKVVITGIIDDIHDKSGNQFDLNQIELKVKELFGSHATDQTEKQVQRHFVQRILTPIAIEIIQASENLKPETSVDLRIGEVFDDSFGEELEGSESNELEEKINESSWHKLIKYLEVPIHNQFEIDWKLSDCSIPINYENITEIVKSVMKNALDNMIEVIDHFGADVVLLTGRPSRLPMIRALIENSCVVRPDRLVSMHKYQTKKWYPYRGPYNEIGDPKSTVSVGGLLLMLAEGRIQNFSVSTNSFQMKSTANYIGKMEIDRKIQDSNIHIFGSEEPSEDRTIKMNAPMHIGSRQLPFERWTTTPLYRLVFVDPESMSNRKPVSIILRRRSSDYDPDPDDPADMLKNEALREDLKIDLAEDVDERNVKKDLKLKFHTLGIDNAILVDNYWLDTGEVVNS